MSRSVKFRPSSGGSHYEHQRSDSGVGSFSDNESRASNPDRDYLAPGYEEQRSIYSLQHALDATRQERDEWMAKVAGLENDLKLVRNEFEQNKARMRALANENELLGQENERLTKANKELTEENKELTEENADLNESAKELKKANRKSSSNSSPSVSTITPSDSSDEKKLRRSSSKKRTKESSGRADKEKEREKEREREHKERERERRKALERAEKEETERLRKRFDARGEESDAKSSSASTKSQRNRRDSYIEPLGHGAPRPHVAAVTPAPARQYSSYTTTTTAPPLHGYPSIREPYKGTTPRSHHPSVYIADEYTAPYAGEYAEEEDPYRAQPVSRSTRHPR